MIKENTSVPGPLGWSGWTKQTQSPSTCCPVELKTRNQGADHVEKYNSPPPLRSLWQLLIQGGAMGHNLSWSRSIGNPLFGEVTLSRRLPWGTVCTATLLVLLLFLKPGGSHHCSVAAVTQLGHKYSYWFCQEHILLQLWCLTSSACDSGEK